MGVVVGVTGLRGRVKAMRLYDLINLVELWNKYL